jgi:hypothetical protein
MQDARLKLETKTPAVRQERRKHSIGTVPPDTPDHNVEFPFRGLTQKRPQECAGVVVRDADRHGPVPGLAAGMLLPTRLGMALAARVSRAVTLLPKGRGKSPKKAAQRTKLVRTTKGSTIHGSRGMCSFVSKVGLSAQCGATECATMCVCWCVPHVYVCVGRKD